MRRTVSAFVVASCFIIGLGTGAVQSKDRGNNGLGISIGGKQGINANVGLGGGKKGLGLGVNASVGGKKGINAKVGANIGNKIAAKVNANVGKTVTANVGLGLGGKKGINAKVDANVGGRKGVNVNIGLGLGGNTRIARTGTDPSNPGGNGNGSLTSSQRQAFNDMTTGERQAMLKRCMSVNSGSYDSSLVNLCKLLRMSAS